MLPSVQDCLLLLLRGQLGLECCQLGLHLGGGGLGGGTGGYRARKSHKREEIKGSQHNTLVVWLHDFPDLKQIPLDQILRLQPDLCKS